MSKSIVVLCRSVDPEGVLPEGGKVAGEGGGGASAEMGSKTDCGYIEPGPEGGSIHVYIQVTLVLHFHLSLTSAAFDLKIFRMKTGITAWRMTAVGEGMIMARS